MSKLNDKVSYLHGLVEGMDFKETDNQSKLILRIIDALDDMSEKIERINENIEDLSDYIESVDDDLESLEFGDEDLDCDFDEDDEDEEDEDDEEPLIDLDDDGEGEFGMYEGCLCPECGGIFSILVNSDEDQQYICPHCQKRVTAVKMNCKNVPVANAFSGEDDE